MPPPQSLANLRPWKPGQSGNPGGKPLLARVIKDLTNNGNDIAEFVVSVMRGDVKSVRSILEQVKGTGGGERMLKRTETAVPVGLRLQAAFWLADRVDPQPKRRVDGGGEDGVPDGQDDLIAMTEPELDEYERHLDSLASIADQARERRTSAASSATIDVTPTASVAVDGGHQPGESSSSGGEDST